jgi:hypothetical protein
MFFFLKRQHASVLKPASSPGKKYAMLCFGPEPELEPQRDVGQDPTFMYTTDIF